MPARGQHVLRRARCVGLGPLSPATALHNRRLDTKSLPLPAKVRVCQIFVPQPYAEPVGPYILFPQARARRRSRSPRRATRARSSTSASTSAPSHFGRSATAARAAAPRRS